MKRSGEKIRGFADAIDELEDKKLDPVDETKIRLATRHVQTLATHLRKKYELTSKKRRPTKAESDEVVATFGAEAMDLYEKVARHPKRYSSNAYGLVMMALCEASLNDPEMYISYELLAERTKYSVNTIATLPTGFWTRCQYPYSIQSADRGFRLVKVRARRRNVTLSASAPRAKNP